LKKRKRKGDEDIRFSVCLSKTIKLEKVKEQLKLFVRTVTVFKEKLDMREFKNFCGGISIEDIEEQYGVLMMKKEDYYIFCGTKSN
jgi:hypothetical protein